MIRGGSPHDLSWSSRSDGMSILNYSGTHYSHSVWISPCEMHKCKRTAHGTNIDLRGFSSWSLSLVTKLANFRTQLINANAIDMIWRTGEDVNDAYTNLLVCFEAQQTHNAVQDLTWLRSVRKILRGTYASLSKADVLDAADKMCSDLERILRYASTLAAQPRFSDEALTLVYPRQISWMQRIRCSLTYEEFWGTLVKA